MRPSSNLFIRQLRARPRLLFSTAFAVLVGVLLPETLVDQFATRVLIAWNAGTCLYILLAAIMMARSSSERIQQRAQLEDEGQHVVLALVVVAGAASLAAIAGELGVVKETRGAIKAAHVALAALTVLSSWAFVHLMFALHYAHDYYADIVRGGKPGLAFPGNDSPDYGDFFYFAAIIGTSAQTADVSLTTSAMRRLGSAHCIISFFFNTTVLALSINIAATLF